MKFLLALAVSSMLPVCVWAQNETATYYTWNVLQYGPAAGINDRGQVLGISLQQTGALAPCNYLYSPDGTYQTFCLHNALIGAGLEGTATGFNVLDQFVGQIGFGLDDPCPFYLYQNGVSGSVSVGQFPLTLNSAVFSYGKAINDAGTILGQVTEETGARRTYGVLYPNGAAVDGSGTATVIAFPNATATYPMALNDAGTVVGYYVGPGGKSHGFYFQHGKYTKFDVPLAKSTEITGINNIGEIVGNYSSGAKGNTKSGFLYSAGTLTPIVPPANVNAAGAVSLVGINDEGEIAGNSGTVAFVARPSYFLEY